MKARTVKFLKEHVAIIFALISFWVFQYAVRWVDPTAATYDAGVLQIPVTTIIYFTIFQWAVWQVVKNLWPKQGEYFKTKFNIDFEGGLTPWQRVKASLFLYFALFAALVLLSRVIS
jgi:hypothetical protein